MLRYDAAWLIAWYAGERPLAEGVPYSWLGGAGPWRIEWVEEEFALDDVMGIVPRLDFDEEVVRLAGIADGVLRLGRARYSDGMRSNYAMDRPGGLREVLRADYGGRLPDLGDRRLSNGIGTAVVVFDGEGRPYLPRRAPRQSVYPGGFHCTASGETVWRGAARGFEDVFTANIVRELEEEVGLRAEDLDWIRPVALCREFLRGGKPQWFYAAATRLAETELGERRRAAIARQIASGRQEVMDEVAWGMEGVTLTMEGRANVVVARGSRE